MGEYGTVTPEAAKQKAAEMESSRGGRSDYQWYRIEPNTTTVMRVLPPWKKSLSLPAMEVYKHYDIPAHDDPREQTSHVCVQRMWPEKGLTCPICYAINKLERNEGVDLGKKKARFNAYLNIVLREKQDAKGRTVGLDSDVNPNAPFICRVSTGVYNWILEQCYDPDVGDVTNPYTGFDVKVKRKGSGLDTEYKQILVPRPVPLATGGTIEDGEIVEIVAESGDDPDDEIINKLLDGMYQLDEIWSFPTKDIFENIKGSAKLLLSKFSDPTESVSMPDEEVEDEEWTDEELDDEEEVDESVAPPTDEVEDEEEDDEEDLDLEDYDLDDFFDEEDVEGKAETPQEEEDEAPSEEVEATKDPTDVKTAKAPKHEVGTDWREKAIENYMADESVQTPEDAIEALGIEPLKKNGDIHPEVAEWMELSAPECFMQYRLVASHHLQACARCHFEFNCPDAAGVERVEPPTDE